MKIEVILLLFLSLYSACNALEVEIKTTKLRNQEECREDIELFCPTKKSTNLNLIKCLQDNMPNDRVISNDCQNLIWQIKYNITRGTGGYVPPNNFLVCAKDVENLPKCKQEKDTGGPYIACLLEELAMVKSSVCLNFLRAIQPLIFTDFRFIYRFADVCKKDIDSLKCGRTNNHLLNEQGTTIDCLSEHLDDLFAECKAEVLKLAEAQANDWRNDRGLFMACREDKTNFCDNLPSDTGLVYKCLLEHKEDENMSKECKAKLRLRQRLQGEDYRANFKFFQSCMVDMKENKCTYEIGDGEDGDHDDANDFKMVNGDSSLKTSHKMKLSKVVLCLETARVAAGKRLNGRCVQEMLQVRKQLMEDHHINKQLMDSCAPEVKRCEDPNEVSRLHDQGMLSSSTHRYVIHCIMDFARHTMVKSQHSDAVSKQCYLAVNRLLKKVDVVDNVDADPALKYDCALTINKHCSNTPRGKGLMINCLMGLLGTDKMETECANRISEVQFFMARDFKLSTRFWVLCENDIKHLCPSGATEIQPPSAATAYDTDVVTQAHVLSCLYRNFDNHMSEECSGQVKMVMEERARSADLPPEIQEVCLSDLASNCAERTSRDDEMACLEENYERLSTACKAEVSRVIDAEDTVPMLTRLFLDACESFWDTHCVINRNKGTKKKNLIDRVAGVDDNRDGDEDEEDEAAYLMECLIKNKNHQDMPKKCKVGIEHHQLVSLKHFNTNSHFKRACTQDLSAYCDNHKDKVSAIKCLSQWVYNDTMLQKTQHVSKKCRKQLKFEILQSRESINLDDEMRDVCRPDRKKFCKGVVPGKGAVIACLKQHQNELDQACRKLIFEREEKEAASPDFDFTLVNKCKRMIKVYCDEAKDLFTCLKRNKDDDGFEEACRDVVVDRMRLRAKDIRLNPKLLKDCHSDIEKECQVQMEKARQKPFEADGIVIYCLRQVFVHKIRRKHMSESCAKHITNIVRESAVDDLQDVTLVNHCSEAIRERCVGEAEADKKMFGGTRVVECLQHKLMTDEKFRDHNVLCFREIIRRMTESKVDIHVDPILYRQCSVDTRTVCLGVVSGESRVMSCLLAALGEDPLKLTKGCRDALTERTDLWNKAVKLAPPETVGDLVSHINSSPARTFFELLLISLVMLIFCGGLLCGRVTKRMAYQLKTK